jgi:PAS domain S-box-containing protein
MEKMPIDQYRLRFPDELEQDFQEDYFQKSLRQLRLGIVLGAAIYALFGILDAWITPDVKFQTWFVRFAVVIPSCIAVLLFSFLPQFKKYWQTAMFCLVLVAGGGILALIVIVRSPVNYFHFAGMLLVIMYSYTFSKLRFLFMSMASWTIVGAYEVVALNMSNVALSVFFTDNFFYIAANLIGMFSGYHRELYMRRDFFHNRMIQKLEEKKHHLEKEQLQEAVEKATVSLRESEARFRTLAETTTAAIFIHEGERILYVNPAGERMSGYTSEELRQRDFWTFIHPDYQELVRERGRARVRGEQVPNEYEFKSIKKNGDECWVTITTGFVEYEGKSAIIATLFDVTDRKRAEEEKTKLFEERIAEEQRHLVEKEKLLRDLHDGIGGITTNISILSELAQSATDIENVKKTLTTISQLSQEGISEIRSFMQSLDSKELNWHALAVELRNQGTTMVVPHRICFRVETSMDGAHEQPNSLLWVNLLKIYKEALTNVIKHSQAGSVTVMLNVDGKGLLFVVQDNGIGWGGNASRGRGLRSMKKRAQELGGGLTVSAAEKGTRVSLEIPFPVTISHTERDR